MVLQKFWNWTNRHNASLLSNGLNPTMTNLSSLADLVASAVGIAAEGEVSRAQRELSVALVAHPEKRDPLHQSLIDALDATVRIYGGDYEAALSLVLPQLSHIEQSGFRDKIDWLYTAIAYALGAMGDPERGLEWVGRAMAMTADQPQSAGRRKAYITLGSLLSQTGDHDAAQESFQNALTAAEQQGELRAMPICCANIASSSLQSARKCGEGTALRRKHAEVALAHADRGLSISVPDGPGQASIALNNYRAEAMLLLGKPEEAKDALERRLHPPPGNTERHIELLLTLAEACTAVSDHAAARNYLNAGIRLAEQEKMERLLLQLLPAWVRLEKSAGDATAALAASERYTQFLEAHYRNRLKVVARSAEVFAEAERLRRESEDLRLKAQSWEDAALRDTLTGIYNRRGLAKLSAELWASKRGSALAIFDADHFKQVNDRFGHGIGDEVLKSLPKIINTQTRAGDVLARIGGEEFILLLADANLQSAQVICERIRAAIETYQWEAIALNLRVTASIGLAAPTEGETLEALILRADTALYDAKHGGRNRVCVAS